MKNSFSESSELDGYDELNDEDKARVDKAWEDGHVADEDIPESARKPAADDEDEDEEKPKKKPATRKKKASDADGDAAEKPKKARASKAKVSILCIFRVLVFNIVIICRKLPVMKKLKTAMGRRNPKKAQSRNIEG